MPRISNLELIRAYRQNRLLPLILTQCRTVESAQIELRWLQERARYIGKPMSTEADWNGKHTSQWRRILRSMCRARSRGVPLQYILGDQPFGDLEVLCRKGVLIPRAETESFTVHIAKLVLDALPSWSRFGKGGVTEGLRVLDLCSGTGCMSLLLHSLLAAHIEDISIVGVDLSPVAVKLGNDNLAHNLRLGLLLDRAREDIQFRRGNVLPVQGGDVPGIEDILQEFPRYSSDDGPRCDVLVSNPPYIAPGSIWDGTTARSVRIFEPALALVPPATANPSIDESIRREDVFYYYIFHLGFKLRPNLMVLECGSRVQAERVVSIYDKIACTYPSQQMAVSILSSELLEGGSDILDGGGPFAVIIQREII